MKQISKAVLLCLALAVSACSDDDNPPPVDNGGNNNGGGSQTSSGPATLIGAEDNHFLVFRAGTPGTILTESPMTGYVGEGTNAPPFIIAMDFRTNGILYVLMSDNRLYTVDSTGHATLVGPLAVGSSVIKTFNFDPARDRIRAFGTLGENYDLNADGTLFTRDTDLFYVNGDANAGQTPDIESLAFTGGNGSATTTAFGMDATHDTLVMIGSPNGNPLLPDSGQVSTLHALSSPVGGAGAPPFDIETVGATPAGYVTDIGNTTSGGTTVAFTHLFKLDLATGTMSDLGEVGHNRRINALTVIPGTSGGTSTGGGGSGAVPGDELCTIPIQGAGVTFDVGTAPPNCLDCSVLNPEHVVDADPDNFARFQYSVGLLLAGVDLTVKAAPGTIYPAGFIAGGTFAFPGVTLLEATVAPDLTITTFLGGVQQESETLGGDTIILDLAGAIVDQDKFFAGFTTTKPFDAVRVLPDDGLLGALTQFDMYRACAGAPDEGAFP